MLRFEVQYYFRPLVGRGEVRCCFEDVFRLRQRVLDLEDEVLLYFLCRIHRGKPLLFLFSWAFQGGYIALFEFRQNT